jgi:hypothetical protein
VNHRDLYLLPIIAIATVLILLFGAEGISRLIWPEDLVDRCMTQAVHDRPKVNCVSTIKTAEGPWVENRYNDCGYRATGPCGPLPQSTARLAIVGSSTSFGYLVPFDHVWSVEAARILAAQCGRSIDVQSLIAINRARTGFVGDLNEVAGRVLPDAIALHPQMVALVLAPFDLIDMPEGGFNPQPTEAIAPVAPFGLKSLISASRAVKMLQHFMFRDASSYVKIYLRYGDNAAFMRPPLSPLWQARLNYVDAGIGYIANQLHAAGIAMLLVYAPQQAQADIIADNMQIPGVDAETLDRAIGAIAKKYDVIFADGAVTFQGKGKQAPEYFYQTDGHLNETGHTLLGSTVAATLAATHGFCQNQNNGFER